MDSASNPHRKRSATMFDDSVKPAASIASTPDIASIQPSHSGTQTPVHSASYSILRKKSHRLQRQPEIPFLTLTQEAEAASAAATSSGTSSPITAPSSALHQTTPADSETTLLHPVSQTPLHTPPITAMTKPTTRPRSSTSMSFKSVDFVLAVEEKLRVDTDIIIDLEAHDADPVFHRSVFSPSRAARNEEVVVEKVGSFDVGCLRKDSLGNLPKITHSPISEDDEETAANTEHNQMGKKAMAKIAIPEDTGRQEPVSIPSGLDGADDTNHTIPLLPGLTDPTVGLISFPPSELPGTPVSPTSQDGFEPKPLSRRPTFEHDAVMPATPPECSAEVTLTDVTIKCPLKKKSLGFRKEFELGLKELATGASSEEERRHSMEAINGMKEILEKSPKGTPDQSRRASAT